MRFQIAALAAVAVASTGATPFGFAGWTLQQATGYDFVQHQPLRLRPFLLGSMATSPDGTMDLARRNSLAFPASAE